MASSAIGFRIRERRKSLGVTQAGFAKLIGISGSYLNLIEANKRAVGGELLERIADALSVDAEQLTGAAERQLLDDLSELATNPLIAHHRLDPDVPAELIGRFPDWSRAMLTLFRAHLTSQQTVIALGDRLNRDPFLSDAVHQMLTHITAIRSTSEILESAAPIDAEQRTRFQSIIASESAHLSRVGRSLAAFFDKDDTETRSREPGDEVDNFLIANRSYFPVLESLATTLRTEIRGHGQSPDAALSEYLRAKHAVTVRDPVSVAPDGLQFENMCAFHEDGRSIVFLANAPRSTRRFQLARIAAELGGREAIDDVLKDAELSSPATRRRAFQTLAAYVGGAVLFPYDAFLHDAIRARYDIVHLAQRYEASFEQICHRLVTLRKESAAGIPFAFLRSDVAGYTAKRFPLADVPLPRHGHACPLLPIFTAFQTPGRIVRQIGEFPDRTRCLMIARTVTRQRLAYHEPPIVHSIMLACDTTLAGRTVYADGLDFSAPKSVSRVGPGCRLCPRRQCAHRQEEPIVQPRGRG